MKASRSFRWLGLMLSVVAILAAFGGMVQAQDEEYKVLQTSLNMVGGDLLTIDPSVSEVKSQIMVVNHLFIGVTEQDTTTGEEALGIAESYEIAEDGITYTFKLRQDIPWVHYNPETGAVEQAVDEEGNVRYVNAHDIVYGVLRTLAPETASSYSYVLLPYIAGAEAYNSGEGAAEDVAVTALDDFTVQYVGTDPASFASSIYGMWMGRPLPQWAIEEGGDSWTEVGYIQTNGPYALKEWAHGESITLIKNPFWPGTDLIPVPKIDEVVLRFLDPQAQFAEYLAGSVDAMGPVPVEEIDRVRADETLSSELVSGTDTCTYYLGFDNAEAPTDNVHLRRALSFSIDRQALVENVTRRGEIAAQWFSRPGMAAAPTLETHPDLGVKYNPEYAQAELALAVEQLGEIPPLSLSYNDSSNHSLIMQAIQQMWADVLGLQVELNPMDPTTYFASIAEEYPQIARAGWCQDYSDANNFLFDVFHSKSSQNSPNWNNAAYDALVEEARLLTDEEARRDLYAQAEQIFVAEEAGIAPIYWYVQQYLVKPYVIDAESVTGNDAYYLWDLE